MARSWSNGTKNSRPFPEPPPMPRLPPIPDASLTDAQRKVVDGLRSGPRGRAGGPFPALLRNPDLAGRVAHLGELLRFGTSLPPRLSEMAILITARAWTAQYEWFAHAPMARKGGLGEAVIEAIRMRRRPAAMPPDESALYDFCTELHAAHGVGDAAYAKAVELFGEPGVVELMAISGYYVMVSMVLNVAEVTLPEGEPLPLAD
jgi:4-carboxymuconolactone decarboxylase